MREDRFAKANRLLLGGAVSVLEHKVAIRRGMFEHMRALAEKGNERETRSHRRRSEVVSPHSRSAIALNPDGGSRWLGGENGGVIRD
jgi:hypothetical protein